MTIQVACQCGKTYSLPDTYAGKKASCKACGAVLVVPPPGASARSSTPPKPPDQAAGEVTLYEASPSMFRNRPVWFIAGLLIPVWLLYAGSRPGGEPLVRGV